LEKIIAWHGAWLDRADMQTVCLIEIEEYMNDMSTHYMMSKKNEV